jgi:hypothetical protein
MTHRTTVASYGRIGLIIAAFALVTAIVIQPLRERMWSPSFEVTDSSQSRMQ